MKKLIFFLIVSSLTLSLGAQDKVVDNSTIIGKWMSGYQCWFNTPEDGKNMSWGHYGAHGKEPTADTLTVDMWPYLAELDKKDLQVVPTLHHADGSNAYAYSSHNENAIDMHFRWMQEYDIDGVYFQYFIGTMMNKESPHYKAKVSIIEKISAAAKKYGRVWAFNFDPAGRKPGTDILTPLKEEWKRIVDSGVTKDSSYLHHNGLPVVHIWSMLNKGDPWTATTPEVAHQILDFFEEEGPYQAFVVCGVISFWRDATEPEWVNLANRIKCFVPWNTGHAVEKDGVKSAGMFHWRGDIEKVDELGAIWMPTIHPGFTWKNMNRWRKDGETNIPRRGGEYYWEQLYELNKLGATDTVFLAMFDEVDEGTAIMKVDPNPPVDAHFVGTDGMPADWWLQLIREARRLNRSGEPFPKTIPLKP